MKDKDAILQIKLKPRQGTTFKKSMTLNLPAKQSFKKVGVVQPTPRRVRSKGVIDVGWLCATLENFTDGALSSISTPHTGHEQGAQAHDYQAND